MPPTWFASAARSRALGLALAAVAGCAAPARAAPPDAAARAAPPDRVPFGPDERERELAFLLDALRASYAHLEVKRRDFGVDLDALFARYRDPIRAAATWPAYERVMVEVVSELHDGHLVWRRRRAAAEGRRRIVRLGLDTVLVGDQLIVSGVWPGSDAARAGLHPGDRILSVDGVTVAEALARRAALRSWSRLEAARYEYAASWAAARLDPGATPRPRALERERMDGARDRLQVAPETAPRPGPPPAPLELERRGATLIAHVRTLARGRAELDGDLEAMDRALAGAAAVVVDLRGDGGGYDRAAVAIAARLAGRALTGGTRRVRLSPATRAARPEWRDLAADPARPGWSVPLPLAAAGRATAPRRLAAVVDAGCLSACEELALLLRAAGARLLGATTGGSSGGPIQVVLPSSGARVSIPVWALYDAAGEPIEDHGVAPDVPCAPTRADVAAGRDAVLERALAEVGG